MDEFVVVYHGVIADSRWDRQVEDRGAFLARLICRLGLGLGPVCDHLFESTSRRVRGCPGHA